MNLYDARAARPRTTDDEWDLILWALSYAHQMLTDDLADGGGEGSITIANRLDELDDLNLKLDFL